MIRCWLALFLAPLAAQAQLQLTAIVGSQSTALTSGGSFTLGPVAPGVTDSFVIQALNTSSTTPLPIQPNTPSLSGAGFTLTPPGTPTALAPGAVLNIYIQFSALQTGSYSAGFQFNTFNVVLIASVVPAATLTVSPPCTGGTASSPTISFGNVSVSQTAACPMKLTNNSQLSITVSSITVTGSGFLLSILSPPTPINLPPGAAATFSVTFAPNSAAVYNGALSIDTQTFPLTGNGSNPPLPAPILQFDATTPQSGQQIALTLTLPAASPIAFSGSINMAFQPDASVASVVTDDPAIKFVATGARSVGFTFQAGATQASLGGQPGAIFSTGSTAGRISFTVTSTAQFTADPTATIVLAPTPVQIDNAAATALAGMLNIQIWGFDNTYSAGPMSFTFFDDSGNNIGAGPISANFSSNFTSYFTKFAPTYASQFAILVSFPITGNSAQVGSATVVMTNSAGTSTVSNLLFINDSGTCVLTNSVLSCPGSTTQ